MSHWTVTQIDHSRTTVGYATTVEWADGSLTTETVGAVSAGVARVSNGDTEIGLWRFPFDPDLPGLRTACDPAWRSATRLRVVVKVVRPNKVERLHELHRIAEDAGCPTPAPLGWTTDGLLLLAALPGETLRARLVSGAPAGLAAADVVALLDALPFSGPPRRTWGQKAPHYAEVLAETVPSLAGRARAIAAAVSHEAPEGPWVPVHGDFYEAQLLVRGRRISGLLDIDTAGTGERADDAACLLAHLSLLAHVQPRAAITELGLALRRRFTSDLDPAVLARRTAAVLLSLATGPHRVHEPGWRHATAARLELAERWLGECPQ